VNALTQANSGHGNAANKGKNRLLLLGLVLFSLWAGLQAATQFFAFSFDYQAVLGANWGKVYTPWSILLWTEQWYGLYPDAVMKAGGIGLMVTIAGLLLTFLLKTLLTNTARASETLHGSARWATKKDIEQAGLLPANKSKDKSSKKKTDDKEAAPFVYVGGFEDKDGTFYYLRHSGPEHILTYAPTRSGKGVGLVIPTLLSWSQSVVINDLKGELWALTAGWRQKYAKNKVLRFEPASAKGSVRWNALDEIRFDEDTGLFNVGDVQNLATLIVDPDGKGLETHWQKTAFSLLVGVILHALYLKKAGSIPFANLATVDKLLSSPERDPAALWQEMVDNRHNPGGLRNDIVASAGQDMKSRPKEEGGSVLSTAKSYLALCRDPIIEKNIAVSDFSVKDLMHHENAVTLYIVTQPNDKGRLNPLVRILVNMIIRMLADKMDFEKGRPVAHYKHRLLMMIDEFPSLGKLEIMQESLAFVAGYGIKCYLICQDLKQLKDREKGYGQDETISSNCHIQNAYQPTNVETAEYLSKLTGQTTVVKEQITTSGKRAGLIMGQVSITFQEVQRPLLTVDEVLRLKGPKKDGEIILESGDMLVYVAGFPAIRGKQPLYFKDPVFQKRAEVAAPKDSDKLRTPENDHLAQGQINAMSGAALCNA